MRLQKFRVTDFRSVDDSGWILASDVTALIGTNESGKTNLLLPLWKLNPAGKDGQIDLLADAPRKRYNEIRAGDHRVPFVQAVLEIDDDLASELASITGATVDEMRATSVTRHYDGDYAVDFPLDNPNRHVPRKQITHLLSEAANDIAATSPLKSEESLKQSAATAIESAAASLHGDEGPVNVVGLKRLQSILSSVSMEAVPKTSTIAPRFTQLLEALDALLPGISRPAAHTIKQATDLVLSRIPKFVYYSNYGNLDSEIYLPHVIENLKRQGIGAKEAAKARTLKVLFEFVKLEPSEIMQLGKELPESPRPSDDQIAVIAKKKKERDVLLQSASTELTAKFRDWWKQGEYRFRFQADGDHFRIWVSDDKRPDDIELEGRSTGLQWFLSFYLIFLVESTDAHEGAILLLDEPGLSLHPLAQRDLSVFFESLSATNQLLYTTHSPFLVDSNHLDRVRAVYIKDDGTTAVSSDLRAAEKQPLQSKSIYPVHAALGITVSDTLLVGAAPIIVEGQSDQFYLSAIKTLLVASGRFSPAREFVFLPAGGVRGVKAVAAIVTGRDEALPTTLVDSDKAGKKLASDLRSGLYAGDKKRVVEIDSIVNLSAPEIEDLIPTEIMVPVLNKYLRGPDEDFDQFFKPGSSIVTQAEAYASKHGLTLPAGWKVEVARLVKVRLLKADGARVGESALETWQQLFAAMSPEEEVAVQ